MKNIYHVIDKIPEITKYCVSENKEKLANKLSKSGLVRIDGEISRNFIKYIDPQLKAAIYLSVKELTLKELEERSINKIIHNIKKLKNQNQTKELALKIFKFMKLETKKLVKFNNEEELSIIRLLIQSSHEIIFKMILKEKVEIFVSYENSIGEIMDIKNWQNHGSNSGMQSTDGFESKIFISTGSNPLNYITNNNIENQSAESLCRLQIIAAQEFGHYADLKRDIHGNIIGRYSMDLINKTPSLDVNHSRKEDIKNCKILKDKIYKTYLNKLIEQDNKILFYNKNIIMSFRFIYSKLIQIYFKYKLLFTAQENKWYFILKFSKEKYLGLVIDMIFEDMLFNLNPKADVYIKNSKEETESIACAEALARIPQQVVKWGHVTTSILMKNLYKYYYSKVIKELKNNYFLNNNKYVKDINHNSKNILKLVFDKIMNIYKYFKKPKIKLPTKIL